MLEIKFQFVTPRFRPFGERMSAKINIVQDGIAEADYLSSFTEQNSERSASSGVEEIEPNEGVMPS